MDKLKIRIYNLLRWSERYTKTDMVYLVSGGSWLTGSQILIALASFLATIILGLYLPKDVYGNYKYVLSVFAILSAFTLTGLHTAIIQSVASKHGGVLQQAFRLGLKWSVFAVLGAIIGASYYFYKDNAFLGYSLILIAFAIPLSHSFGLFGSYLVGSKEFKKFGITCFIENVFPLACVIISIFFTKNILLVLVCYFIASISIKGILFFYTIHTSAKSGISDQGLAKYSIKLSALNIISTIAAHIDKVLIFTSFGAVELAIYSFASAFPDRIRSLLKNLTALMVPKFSENKTENRTIVFSNKVVNLSVLLILTTVAYIICAPFLYALFFPNYMESVFFSRLLALTILSSIAVIPLSFFIAEKREDYFAKATLGGSLFQLVVLVPLTYYMGIVGVVISRILGSYAIAGISYYLLYKEIKQK